MITLNCFQNCKLNIKSLFCCHKKHSQERIENKYKPVSKLNNFQIKKLKNIDTENIFEIKEDIIFTIIINNIGEVVSFQSIRKHDNIELKMIDDLKKILPEKLQRLIKTLHQSVMTDKKLNGCHLIEENFDYSLLGIPIINEDKLLSTIIIKKIYIDDTIFDIE